MAYEIFNELGFANAKADIWSFGAMMYSLLTGKFAHFAKLSETEVQEKLELIKGEQWWKFIPLLQKCLNWNPSKWSSIDDVLSYFELSLQLKNAELEISTKVCPSPLRVTNDIDSDMENLK